MIKEPDFYLSHIIEAIGKVRKYTKGFERDDFLQNELVQDAVVRNIEIIGEAAKNLPDEFKKKHSNIQWRDISGMRDRIVHFYFGIDFELVWDTIETDISNPL